MFGRPYGSNSRKLPARLPVIRLLLLSPKSLAGFMTATVTGTAVALGFLSFIMPIRNGSPDIFYAWQGGVRQATTVSESTSVVPFSSLLEYGFFHLPRMKTDLRSLLPCALTF